MEEKGTRPALDICLDQVKIYKLEELSTYNKKAS
jgi:hypothetical protein